MLDDATINKIAHLARLGTTPAEVTAYQNKLNPIFGWIEQLQSVDTTNIEPMAHPFALEQPVRPDQVTEPDQHKTYQALAPRVEAGLYLVPVVIE